MPLENAAVAKDISIDAVAAGNPTPAENVLATTVSTALPFIQLIYFAGIAILLSRTIYAAARISLLIRKSRKETFGGHTLCVHTEKGIAPFSWGRYIVLSDDDRCNAILSHECRHIGARHWIDIAIAECFCIFAWYNPAVWLYKNLVKLNHEFEADAAVISSGIAVSEYQHLLIAKAVGNRAMPLAASFATNSRNFRKRVLLIELMPPFEATQMGNSMRSSGNNGSRSRYRLACHSRSTYFNNGGWHIGYAKLGTGCWADRSRG